MALTWTRAVRLSDPSGPPEARRLASGLARESGFDDRDVGRIALVVTEACTNVTKHAGSGVVALNAWRSPGGPVFQVLAVDAGPGFDVQACLRDGHSTTGTPGSGLGAAKRLADGFDVYSSSQGSVLVADFRDHRSEEGRYPFQLGAISVAKEGEEDCGDAWAASFFDRRVRVFVADGIGHGTVAADAARTAVRAFEEAGERDPGPIIERVHGALRATRGATVALTAIDPPAGMLCFAGVGNIAASVIGAGSSARHLVSHNGTAGHEVRKIQEFQYPWPEDGVLVMASDGLGTRWDVERYPGLLSHHAGVIAGVLYRDFGRPRDDVTVVVGRSERPRGAVEPT